MNKSITVYPKKKKKKWTKYDLERLHDRWIDMIDRHAAIYKLPDELKIFWEIYDKCRVDIKEQISILKERTGKHWDFNSYYKTRKRLLNFIKS